ncbi:MAG: molybdopterin-binding protein, partial [Clostridiales Family XIII bacterium]|nr:molybdopterin-binding protein [Clostridiales Family XIII bacterium]
DIILPRVMADIPITKEDINALAAGGLCLNCEHCIFPACGFGAL